MKLDDRLGTAGESLRHNVHVAPPPFAHLRHRRRRRRQLAAVTTLVVLAAVGTIEAILSDPSAGHRTRVAVVPPSPQPSPSADVPWVDRPPVPVPPSPVATTTTALPAADARPCGARDATVAPDGTNGAGGTLLTYLRFTNISASTCVLKGTPRTTAREPGQPVLVATPEPPGAFGSGAPANMAPGQSSGLDLVTFSSCAANPSGGQQSTYHAVTLDLRGAGRSR